MYQSKAVAAVPASQLIPATGHVTDSTTPDVTSPAEWSAQRAPVSGTGEVYWAVANNSRECYYARSQ